jgi:hypothetical protein
MFKLPNGIPTIRSQAQEWADYAEYLAMKERQVSLFNVMRAPLLVADETEVNGIEDDSDKFNERADEISSEITRRIGLAPKRYPFSVTDKGYVIQFQSEGSPAHWVYQFLLFSTRLQMTKEKVQSGLDGTLLFERLCAEVAKEFFGENTEVEVIGTSRTNIGGFRSKLSHLTKRMREGGDIHQHPGFKPQDDNVDVVLWKGFTDQKPSQLIAFGQCKTGTSWSDRLSELNTDAFCKTWFTRQPVLTPLRMFFCAQYFPEDIWLPRANEAGLVFDRFRIIDYLPEQPNATLMEEIKSWCLAAAARYPND